MTEQTNEQIQNGAEAQTQQPADPQEAELNINDLNAMKQIIDIASSRGAFKAAELEAVGKIYNKLSGFLSQVAAKGQQNG